MNTLWYCNFFEDDQTIGFCVVSCEEAKAVPALARASDPVFADESLQLVIMEVDDEVSSAERAFYELNLGRRLTREVMIEMRDNNWKGWREMLSIADQSLEAARKRQAES